MEVCCRPQYRPRERYGYQIVIHEPTPEGLVRFLVFRLPKNGARQAELAGCGTGGNVDLAQVAADEMVTRLSVTQWRKSFR